MIKHIFSDMDGTLLTSDGKITKETIEAITETKIETTLVSARAPIEMKWATDVLGVSKYQVSFNGGLVIRYENDEEITLFEKYIDPQIVLDIFLDVRKKLPNISINLYGKTEWLTDREDSGVEHQRKVTGRKPTICDIRKVLVQEPLNVFKITMVTFNSLELEVLEEMFTLLAISGINAHQTSPYHFEITHAEAIKSNGVQQVLNELQLTSDNIMVIGDGDNDIPMLKLSKYPVAMGNAKDHVKEIACFVTKTNDENGVAHSFKALLK
ncbi:HAD family hydrolase [Vagococcus sp.]|uniref:HAD family hydrolase n=1 Tax=Vagococcus sp. TaxID=1933889 RepID=UPI003F9DFDB9